jgi:hypothetical protein
MLAVRLLLALRQAQPSWLGQMLTLQLLLELPWGVRY